MIENIWPYQTEMVNQMQNQLSFFLWMIYRDVQREMFKVPSVCTSKPWKTPYAEATWCQTGKKYFVSKVLAALESIMSFGKNKYFYLQGIFCHYLNVVKLLHDDNTTKLRTEKYVCHCTGDRGLVYDSISSTRSVL